MRIALIGLPGSGKTTVFKALTGIEPDPASRRRLLAASGTVTIPDTRLQALSELYLPKKTTGIHLTFGDLEGVDEQGGVSAELANELAQWDALMLILRGFENPAAASSMDPRAELEMLRTEFTLQDQLSVERRLERLAEDRQKGAGDRAALDRELEIFGLLANELAEQGSVQSLDPEIRGYGLLTAKPIQPVLNLEEGIVQSLKGALPIYGKLEEELSQLPADEAASFRAEFGVEQPGVLRLLQAGLELLGRISFFTVSEREVKAWPLEDGATALEAAGTIHTDMARGFIRAEVVGYGDFMRADRSLNQAREKGLVRNEGRDYVVADGDIIYVKFNV